MAIKHHNIVQIESKISRFVLFLLIILAGNAHRGSIYLTKQGARYVLLDIDIEGKRLAFKTYSLLLVTYA